MYECLGLNLRWQICVKISPQKNRLFEDYNARHLISDSFSPLQTADYSGGPVSDANAF